MGKKNKQSPPQKEMSEGKAIAITVLLVAAGLIAFIFAIQFLIGYLFPNW